MGKQINILNLTKWLWSLSPTAWIISFGTFLNIVLTSFLCQYAINENPVAEFIVIFILTGFVILVVGGIIFTIVEGLIHAWPEIKKHVQEWWSRKPQ